MNSNSLALNASRRSRRAFTLIELLVVISIVAVLAAISLPIISSVRAKSNQVKCMHQLKQWGAAIALYAGEHNQSIYFYEGSGSTPGYMSSGITGDPTEGPYQRYMSSVAMVETFRTCPAFRGAKGTITYGFNQPKADGKTLDPTDFINLTRVSQPSNLLLLIDTTAGSKNLKDASALDTFVKPICMDPAQTRHPGSANALFADFHAESIPWASMDRDTDEEKKKCDAWFTIQ